MLKAIETGIILLKYQVAADLLGFFSRIVKKKEIEPIFVLSFNKNLKWILQNFPRPYRSLKKYSRLGNKHRGTLINFWTIF